VPLVVPDTPAPSASMTEDRHNRHSGMRAPRVASASARRRSGMRRPGALDRARHRAARREVKRRSASISPSNLRDGEVGVVRRRVTVPKAM
jgi:hypothetical protein